MQTLIRCSHSLKLMYDAFQMDASEGPSEELQEARGGVSHSEPHAPPLWFGADNAINGALYRTRFAGSAVKPRLRLSCALNGVCDRVRSSNGHTCSSNFVLIAYSLRRKPVLLPWRCKPFFFAKG